MTAGRPPVVILYEDSADGALVRSFGPHVLAMAALADVTETPFRDLEREFHAVPKRGNGNVLKECRERGVIFDRFRAVVAVYDSDRIRKLVGLPQEACRKRTIEELKNSRNSQRPDSLRIVFIEQNTESLLAWIRNIDASAATPDEWSLALDLKDRPTRDAIFARIAAPERRALRDRMRRETSLEYLVKVLRALLPPSLP